MEDEIAGLSLHDDEEKAWLVTPDASGNVSGFDLCLVDSFLTASVIRFEAMHSIMANLWHPIGGVSISDLVEKRFRFRFYAVVNIDRLDVRLSLKQRKRFALTYQQWVYARFCYERLSLFCNKLGHSECFCPRRLILGSTDVSLEWDISLQAQLCHR
ncbi:hypothetical protein Golob_017704 [Gossypium lobatum]|uniref:DUF4283 domain-containing protein n=1 Tax=Gossypium lobatum TaxID=34289 RepID=A0A7J8M7Y4_9ROSI|nr:hypothetical protein [Gossypium lobatum]